MDRFEYATGLMSIIAGLALADLATSAHRLVKTGNRLVWDTLAVASAGYVAFTLIRMWFALWGVRAFEGLTGLWFYLSLILEMFVLFLAAAVALPDERDVPVEGPVDLAGYYNKHRTYLWLLLAVFQLAFGAHALFFQWSMHGGPGGPPLWAWALFVGGPLVIYLALATLPSRRGQGALLVAVACLEVFASLGTGLS
ncbi:hypothetical protein [Brevundimonas aurifodinae]|uniref:Uncharacterized protein n=1 Tax=Brevundimonas aurifodinae TaxID=1508312 RepID=A0ABV1NL55_9CAUL